MGVWESWRSGKGREYTQVLRTLKEFTEHITAERARQALLDRPGVPAGVRVGSLTSYVMDGAAWRDTNASPSTQEWADEAERLLNFAVSQNQFPLSRALWVGPSLLSSSTTVPPIFASRSYFPDLNQSGPPRICES
jgi:hypothetical protein